MGGHSVSSVEMGILAEAAMLIPGVVRVGALRVPVFGVFAAVGLVGALWLSQRTAKAAGVDSEKLWDAGMFAVVAAFVVSRVLVIAMDLRAFMAYPLLVLSLPSLTYGGIALTGVLTWLWLRWKRLRVLSVLDAWAPCAMVLWAALSLGHFVEGTDAGMPTKMPWGVVTAGDSVLGKVHPVQIYALVVAVVFYYWLLKKLQHRRYEGQVAISALVMGGMAAFFLDMLRQPLESTGNAWLDPAQWVALICVSTGLVMLKLLYRPLPPPTREEVAQILEDFAESRTKAYEHEIVEYARFTDPLLVDVQEKVIGLFGRMSQQQKEEMLQQARRLRESAR